MLPIRISMRADTTKDRNMADNIRMNITMINTTISQRMLDNSKAKDTDNQQSAVATRRKIQKLSVTSP